VNKISHGKRLEIPANDSGSSQPDYGYGEFERVIGVSIVPLRLMLKQQRVINDCGLPTNSRLALLPKPIDTYSLAAYMLLIAAAAIVLAARIYPIRRSISIFLLGSTVFCWYYR